jgi:preprotein translocase SecF subunit
MRLFENADYVLIPNRTKGYIFSGILLTVAVLSLAFKGLALGIDFQGGMEFVIENTGQLSTVEVREELTGVLDQQPEVKRYGQTGLLIRTSGEGETSQVENQIMSTIEQAFPEVSPDLERTDIVGPRFAEDLKRGAMYSVLGALFIIFVYILIRFEWRYSMGAVAALIHDVTITLGLFSLLSGVVPFSLQIDQAIIAAFLTIVGYSLNDTVVVFDRIREYANLFKTESFDEVVNKSINTTLSRTVVTSVTTLIVVTILFIFGGEVLRGFSFALIVGVMIGTYSSVFVASPVVVELKHWEERRAVQQG